MQTYETIFIVPPDLPGPRLDEFIEKIKSLVLSKEGGEIVSIEKWGRRRLSYPIRRQREGFYVFITFKAHPSILAELTKLYRVSEDIIRELTCIAPRPNPVIEKPASLTPAGTAAAATAVPGAAPAVPSATPAAPAPEKEVPHAEPSPVAPAQ